LRGVVHTLVVPVQPTSEETGRHPTCTTGDLTTDLTGDLAAAVHAARQGDEAGFVALYRDVQPRLLRYATVLVGRDAAEDVTAEAWLQISRDLHKFVGDDWSLDPHDHPKRFWSIGLRGWYDEHTYNGYHQIRQRFHAPWLRTFPAEHIHRLTGPTPERPCWTLVIVGRTVRRWGFWNRGTWLPWRTYVDSDNAKEMKSC